ncbi:MAG: caspase family protein [Treponema sp.]|nr:caspase family protein [Treponema sp.]
MKKLASAALFLLFSTSLFAQGNPPEIYSPPQKFALVIGNGDYSGGLSSLANPENDARDVAAVLEYLGFTVDTVINSTLIQIDEAVLRLHERLSEDKNSYGFFFYAGHGVGNKISK